MKYWVIGDIHGEFGHLMKLMRHIRKNGFSFKRGHRLVQLGDRCDRGPDTFRVNNYFYKLDKRYPGQVICLKGNHDSMMISAAMGQWDVYNFFQNGGKKTMQSYKCYSNNPQVLLYKLQDCGHLKWIDRQPFFYETDEYVFTHAPIPINAIRDYSAMGDGFKTHENTCTWSYKNGPIERWVDPELVKDKISVHGHIHGIRWTQESSRPIIPGIRVVGNSYLIDTGAGCHEDGYLTCLQLPDMIAYTSKGEILDAVHTTDSVPD